MPFHLIHPDFSWRSMISWLNSFENSILIRLNFSKFHFRSSTNKWRWIKLKIRTVYLSRDHKCSKFHFWSTFNYSNLIKSEILKTVNQSSSANGSPCLITHKKRPFRAVYLQNDWSIPYNSYSGRIRSMNCIPVISWSIPFSKKQYASLIIIQKIPSVILVVWKRIYEQV